MKNYDIKDKTLDFFKKNGKNIICSTLAAVALMVPCKAKLDSSKEEVTNTIKMEEIMENEELVFVVKTEWKKTNKYSDGKGPVKERREYKRTINRFKVTDSFNEEYFNNDYEKILETIRDSENVNDFLEMIDSKKEVIVVSESEEKALDQDNWSLEVEGTDIKASILNPKLNSTMETYRASFILSAALIGPMTLAMIFMLVAEIITEYRCKKKKKSFVSKRKV